MKRVGGNGDQPLKGRMTSSGLWQIEEDDSGMREIDGNASIIRGNNDSKNMNDNECHECHVMNSHENRRDTSQN